MKLKLIITLLINFITTTRREEVTTSIRMSPEETISELKELYDLSNNYCELSSAINWIIHYICNDDDRSIIKDEVVLKIKSCLDLCYVEEIQKDLLKSMINKIKNGNNLHDFSEEDFFNLFVNYYYYVHNLIVSKQVRINKNKFESILESRRDLDSLKICVSFMTGSNVRSLLKAMSPNLKKLILLKPSDLNILRTLNKCEEILKNPIDLIISNYEFKFDNFTVISNKYTEVNIKRLIIEESDLRIAEPVLFLKSILSNKNIEELTIKDTYLTEDTVNDIISALRENESQVGKDNGSQLVKENESQLVKESNLQLKSLILNNLKIDENLLLNLLEECKNNKKLKKLQIKEIPITGNISKKLSEILKGENNLEIFSIISDKIGEDNDSEGIISSEDANIASGDINSSENVTPDINITSEDNNIVNEDNNIAIINIAKALKENKKLLELEIHSNILQLNDFRLILNSILENNESKIKQIIFKGRTDLYNSASAYEKALMFKAEMMILLREINLILIE